MVPLAVRRKGRGVPGGSGRAGLPVVVPARRRRRAVRDRVSARGAGAVAGPRGDARALGRAGDRGPRGRARGGGRSRGRGLRPPPNERRRVDARGAAGGHVRRPPRGRVRREPDHGGGVPRGGRAAGRSETPGGRPGRVRARGGRPRASPVPPALPRDPARRGRPRLAERPARGVPAGGQPPSGAAPCSGSGSWPFDRGRRPWRSTRRRTRSSDGPVSRPSCGARTSTASCNAGRGTSSGSRCRSPPRLHVAERQRRQDPALVVRAHVRRRGVRARHGVAARRPVRDVRVRDPDPRGARARPRVAPARAAPNARRRRDLRANARDARRLGDRVEPPGTVPLRRRGPRRHVRQRRRGTPTTGDPARLLGQRTR